MPDHRHQLHFHFLVQLTHGAGEQEHEAQQLKTDENQPHTRNDRGHEPDETDDEAEDAEGSLEDDFGHGERVARRPRSLEKKPELVENVLQSTPRGSLDVLCVSFTPIKALYVIRKNHSVRS